MRKLERILVLGATHCLAVLALAACGSEDNGTEGYNTNTSAATTGTPTAGTTGSTDSTSATSNSTTSVTSGTSVTTGGMGVTSTTGDATTGVTGTTGTTGAAVTTGTTGFGMTAAATGAGGASSVTSTTGNGTTGVTGATSTTGGTDEVFCDTSLSGEEYFKRPQGCAQCHGVDALGTDDDGPEVRHPNADYLRWIVREGRMDHPDYPEGMPEVTPDCLTDQQIEEIIVFLDSFPQPTTGEELYADYCANCHGADGNGGVTGVGLNGELHHNADIVPNGENTTNYATRGAYMPGQADHLTAAEVQMITDYLQNDLGFGF